MTVMIMEQYIYEVAKEVPSLLILAWMFKLFMAHAKAVQKDLSTTFENALKRVVQGFKEELDDCHKRHSDTESRVDLIIRTVMKGNISNGPK